MKRGTFLKSLVGISLIPLLPNIVNKQTPDNIVKPFMYKNQMGFIRQTMLHTGKSGQILTIIGGIPK